MMQVIYSDYQCLRGDCRWRPARGTEAQAEQDVKDHLFHAHNIGDPQVVYPEPWDFSQYNEALLAQVDTFKPTYPDLVEGVTIWWLILSTTLGPLVAKLPPVQVDLAGEHNLLLTWRLQENTFRVFFGPQDVTMEVWGPCDISLTLDRGPAFMDKASFVYRLFKIIVQQFLRQSVHESHPTA
jgi:hypothetical protein